MKIAKIFITCAVLCAACVGCTSTSVSRVSSSSVTDISGYWNDTDVRIVCNALIEECISSPRISKFAAKLGRQPVVIVGRFKNDSTEHIDTSIIIKRFESAIINSGVMEFVASKGEREDVRSEREEQNMGYSSDETAKAFGNETGADFMLQGSVKSIVQKSGNTTIRTYHVSAELIDIETNKKLWSGFNDEIKKVIKSPNVIF